jgi:hypothetical protein
MSQTKHVGKRKRSKSAALSVMGVAGMSLVATTAATTTESVAGMPTPVAAPNHAFALSEEEISDVTLATFNVFDKDKVAGDRSLLTLVQRCGGCRCGGRCGGCRCGGGRCGCRCGGGGCGGCGCGGCGCIGGCCLSWGGCKIWC